MRPRRPSPNARGRGGGHFPSLWHQGERIKNTIGALPQLMVSDLAEKIRGLLPKDGSTLGNTYLIRSLAVQPEDYLKARAELEDAGLIVRGVGRGGTIRLARPVAEPVEPKAPGGVKEERSLYDPLKRWFDKVWGVEYKPPDFYTCKITGSPAGHKRRSGKWSRPDLAIVTIASAEFFVPSKTLEVTTVEVKRYSELDVVAVFEAASHGKFGHQSYLAVEWLEEKDMDKPEASSIATDVMKEAQRFGVGVLQMRPRGSEWDVQEVLEPHRNVPDPEDCSGFIEQVFEDHHKQIRNAIK